MPPAPPVETKPPHLEACELSRQMLLALAHEYDALDMCEAPVHWRHVAADLRRRVAMLPPAPAPPAPSGVPRAVAWAGGERTVDVEPFGSFVALSASECAKAVSVVNLAVASARERGRQDMDLTVGSLVSNLASVEAELRAERQRNAPPSDVPKAEVFKHARELTVLRERVRCQRRQIRELLDAYMSATRSYGYRMGVDGQKLHEQWERGVAYGKGGSEAVAALDAQRVALAPKENTDAPK